MLSGIPTGSFFYIEQPDRSSGIRVENNSGNATPAAGSTVSLSGTVLTDGITHERYILADTLSASGTGNDVGPLGSNTRAIHEDTKLEGMYVKTAGTVRSIDSSGGGLIFTIADGYTTGGAEVPTTVLVYGDEVDSSDMAIGDFVKLTGVVSQESPTTIVVILRSFSVQVMVPNNPPHSWRTGFEPGESYTTGTLVGQNGWTYGWDYTWQALQTAPIGLATATVVNSSGGDPVIGTQALKLSAPNTYTVNLLNMGDEVTVRHLTTTADLKYVVLKFKLWRDPGTQNLPYAGPDPAPGTYPTIRSNTMSWWTQDPYYNAGWQWDISYNTQPWSDGGNSVPTITGRYVEVLEYLDFVTGKVSAWYDGTQVDEQRTMNPAPIPPVFTDIEFNYIATQPFLDGAYGRPAYIDDLYVGWATTAD
jgi:hypothetical protein